MALAIVGRECGDFITPSCLKLFRDIAASIGEPTIWTALWRMREAYAEFILMPPMWFVTMAALGTGAWYLGLIGRYLVLGDGELQSSGVRQEWIATRALNWPFSQASGRPSALAEKVTIS